MIQKTFKSEIKKVKLAENQGKLHHYPEKSEQTFMQEAQ